MSLAKRIAIADADPFIRERIRLVAETSHSHMLRIAEADNFEVLMDLVHDEPPIDLVIVGLDLPGMSSAEGLGQLAGEKNRPRIAVLVPDKAMPEQLRPAGVDPADLIPKALPQDSFAKVVGRVLDEVGSADAASEGHSRLFHDDGELTARQRDVLKLLSKGYSNSEIARALGVAEGTVKVHVNAAFRTLKVHNRVQAAAAFRAYLDERDETDEHDEARERSRPKLPS